MSFNKYVAATGIALSFLIASLIEAKAKNSLNSDCKSAWRLYNELPIAEQSNPNNELVKVLQVLFAEKCDVTKDRGQGRTAYASPKALTPEECENEPASCKLVRNKPTADLANKDLDIKDVTEEQLLRKYGA